MIGRAILPRAAAVAIAVVAGALAWWEGGGAEARPPPPHAKPAATASSAAAGRAKGSERAGDEYEVTARLIELAKDARFDMPNADAVRHIMKAHWRQQRPPFTTVPGENARFVTSIALRTSATETQWAQPISKDGNAWRPDARQWNMNEGSFDQREAFLSPSPGTIKLRVDVPQGGRFTFAEGTINASEDATVFAVTVVSPKGTKEVYRHVLLPSASRKWSEGVCDLSAYAGQNVELQLRTETTRAFDGDAGAPAAAAPDASALPESAFSGPGNGRPSLDGGVVREAKLDAPSTPVALWGNPTILAKTTPRVPYNVVWIVIDALRPDVIASFHDDAEDAAKMAAQSPPLEALLPKIPGLTPEIDALTKKGVRFTHAYSAGSWTRPGTLAMLSGARSTELGVDTTSWMLFPRDTSRFYASDPPLLPLAMRRQGVVTRAFVNNYFMVGYAPVGIEMGFERVDDHRFRTRDTMEITQDATQWIRDNKDTRFFAFVNYNSPHEPYEPPQADQDKVPPPPAGPHDTIARLYMAEASKDDAAIGVLMRTLDETKLRDRTIVVVTADHGETLSSAHSGNSGLDNMPIRYHHAVSNFEETTRVPILIVAPGLPAGAEVKARVRSVDIAPTLLELLGMEKQARGSGKSMVALAKGQAEPEERVVVSEGRGTRAILVGHHRLLVRHGPARIVIHGDTKTETDAELYDLDADPGERHDIAPHKPELVAELRARLDAALKNAPVPGGAEPSAAGDAQKPPTLHLRFAGGSAARRVSGTIRFGDDKAPPKTFDVQPVELGRDAFTIDGPRVDIALRTSPTTPVGFDIVVDPPGTPITWDLWLDEKPWPEEGVFGGPFGLVAPLLKKGIASDEARYAASAIALPMIDTQRDVGMFVARERHGEPGGAEDGAATDEGAEGAEEMARLLREWGYAHGSSAKK